MSNKQVKLVASNFSELLNSNLFSDFSIIINNEVLSCHKCILYGSSEFFKGFLKFDETLTELKLPSDILTSKAVKNCLFYIYGIGFNIDIVSEELEETYVAADYFQISNLKVAISERIASKFSVENVFGIVGFAIVYNDKALQMKAQNFINNHFSKLSFENKDFLQLKFDVIYEILSDKRLSSTDYLVLKSLVAWGKEDFEARKLDLLKYSNKLVAFHFISRNQWIELENSYPYPEFISQLQVESPQSRYYSDCQHRIGTPIVLYGVGPKSTETMERNENLFYVDSQSVTNLSSMEENRTNLHICCSSTYIFVVGGESVVAGYILNSCERYNLVENCWETMAALDKDRSNFTIASLEGYVYLFGGYITEKGFSSHSRDILVYDSGADRWRDTGHRSSVDLIDCVSVAVNGTVFLAKASDCINGWPQIWEWDPIDGSFMALSSQGLPTGATKLSLSGTGYQNDDEDSNNNNFLLMALTINDGNNYAVFNYHFSLNRWRCSVRLPDNIVATDNSSLNSTGSGIEVDCCREFVALIIRISSSLAWLENRRDLLSLVTPLRYHDDSPPILYFRYRIDSGWSGDIDFDYPELCRTFSATAGSRFILSPYVCNV